uniref:ETH protein n=1 Tax=Sarcophaga crassipalpis TaxID=59312 RepID=A0A0C6DUL9_SARCR|nr:ecdysis triggering hormone [Sarcophaga crassipalpis]
MRFCCLIIYALVLLLLNIGCQANDSPGFFLKITKNVPRLGRRSDKDFESGFLKNYKIIPRIGRSAESDNYYNLLQNWLNSDAGLKKFNKRVLLNAKRHVTPERELSVVQPVNSNTLIELLDKDAIPSDNVKFVHWKDFDRALQLDAELYGKVISLGRRPDQRLKQDLSMGSYIPLIGSDPDDEANNFMFYNQGNGLEGSFKPDALLYNRI